MKIALLVDTISENGELFFFYIMRDKTRIMILG